MKKVLGKTVKVATEEQIAKVVKDETLSKSKKMVALFEMGVDVKIISELLTAFEGKLVRYNFVYNVVSNHARVNGIETMSERDGQSKKDQIIEMFLSGKSNKEISIELKTNYNYVFNTIKQYKAANPTAVAMEVAEEAQ